MTHDQLFTLFSDAKLLRGSADRWEYLAGKVIVGHFAAAGALDYDIGISALVEYLQI